MIDQNRLDAIEDMLSAFVASVSERRVTIFAKRTQEYALDVLKRACVRLVENSDRTPSVARLREACMDVRREDLRGQPDAQHGDWVDEILSQGQPWANPDGGLSRRYWSESEREGWRGWMTERLERGWTEKEISEVVMGAKPRDWEPDADFEQRAKLGEEFAAFRAARTPRERESAVRAISDRMFKSLDEVLTRGRTEREETPPAREEIPF